MELQLKTPCPRSQYPVRKCDIHLNDGSIPLVAVESNPN